MDFIYIALGFCALLVFLNKLEELLKSNSSLSNNMNVASKAAAEQKAKTLTGRRQIEQNELNRKAYR